MPPRNVNRLRLVVAALGGAVTLGLVYTLARSAMSDPVPSLGSSLDVGALGDRVLVIAPHPDDEIINPAGLIAQARGRGAEVKVVMLTVGDGYRRAAERLTGKPATLDAYLRLGELRASESRAALSELGVPPKDRVYLAYSDGSLNSLWEHEWDVRKPHTGANGKRAVPYAFAARPGRAYCGANLAADLSGIIEEYQPTAVVYPDAKDTHHDHWAAAAFCDYALERTDYRGVRLTYITHFGHYPYPWAYLPSAYLRPPSGLAHVGLRWHSLPLPSAVEALKQNAIRRYASQMRVPDMRVYLLAFVRRNELFASYAAPDIRTSFLNEVPATKEQADRATVLTEPSSGRPTQLVDRRGTIREIKMVRSPSTVWIGIHTRNGAPADLRYDFQLRLFGEHTRRIDIAVTENGAEALRLSERSFHPDRIRLERAADTLWIGLDGSVFEGYRSCLVSGKTLAPGARKACRSAWRPVRL
jgi:N-acetyl-1-D-myo-inositol-2-amino-2-deoxy-alpha-D-glucopyranoside deacetylase